MSTETNKAVIRRWVAGGWNAGRLELVDELYSPHYVIHDPSQPDGGPAQFKQFVASIREAFPDFQMTIEDMVAEGDKVAWRFSNTGTHRGVLMGIPPTGLPGGITGTVVSRFADGKWAEDYVQWDIMGLLRQLKALPAGV